MIVHAVSSRRKIWCHLLTILSLPMPQLPEFSIFLDVLPDAFVISLVSFTTSISVSDFYARKHKYQINPNRVSGLSHGLFSFNWSVKCAHIGAVCTGRWKHIWVIFSMLHIFGIPCQIVRPGEQWRQNSARVCH